MVVIARLWLVALLLFKLPALAQTETAPLLKPVQPEVSRAIGFEQRSQPDSAAANWQQVARYFDPDRQPAAYWRYRSRQAINLAEAGQYEQAQQLSDSVRVASRQFAESDNLLEAESEMVLGIIAKEKSQYGQALTYQQRALTIRQRLGVTNVLLADSYLQLGTIHYFLDHDSLARAYYQQALTLRRSALGEQHADVAQVYQHLMNVSFFMGESDTALAYGQKTLSILKATIGEENGTYASSLSMLANIYGSRGDADRAVQLHQQALTLTEKAYGSVHAKTARAYQNVGWAYDTNDEYVRALAYELQALQRWKQLYGDDHPRLLTIHHILGGTYAKSGNYSQALLHYRRNLALNERYNGENKAALMLPYQNLGRVSFQAGQYQQADTYYQQALAIQLATRGEKHLYTVSLYADMATNSAKAGQLDQALRFHQQGLRVARLIHGERHADVARSYYELARVTADRRDWQTALQFVQQTFQANLPAYQSVSIQQNPSALREGKQAFSRSQLWNALHLKMKLFHQLYLVRPDQSNLASSWETFQVLDSLITDYWRSDHSDAERPAIARIAADIYKDALPVSLRLTNNVSLGFELAQKSKAMLLTAALSEAMARRSAHIPDSLLQQENELRVAIGLFTQRLAQLDSLTGDNPNTIEVRNALFNANRRFDALITHLEQTYPRYYQRKYQSTLVTVAQFQQRLNAKTALIDYVLTDSLVVAFVLTKAGIQVHTSRKDTLLTRRMAAYRTSIIERDQRSFNKLAYALYRQFFPFSLANGITHLLIAPTGELAGIPFEALLTKPTTSIDERNKPYLLRRFAVQYAYSAKLWYQSVPFRKRYSSPTLLALAPVFMSADQPVQVSLQTKRWLTNASVDSSMTTRAGQYIQPLPASEGEVTAIARLINQHGGSARLLLREQAREDSIKAAHLATYQYVHIATHGLLSSRPELSGLLLTQDSTSVEDGILYSGELYNLTFNADLVVLSACETGLGQVIPGEGVLSLSRALLYAGARNVVVSLWHIADASSAQLMTQFYKGLLASVHQADALREAKLSLLSNGVYASPYYWSAFTLVSGGK